MSQHDITVGRALARPLDPKFLLGQTVITANAYDQLSQADVAEALQSHASGDWGELCSEDAAQNDRALLRGGRVFSAYTSGGRRFWIITEADRSVTTVLMPQDY